MAEVTGKLMSEPGISTQQIRGNKVVEGPQPFPKMDGTSGAENSKLSRSCGCFQPRKQTSC